MSLLDVIEKDWERQLEQHESASAREALG